MIQIRKWFQARANRRGAAPQRAVSTGPRGIEVLEARIVLSATPRFAALISGWGGADYPDRIEAELVAAGFTGIGGGQSGLLSHWNSKNPSLGDPGGWTVNVSADTISAPPIFAGVINLAGKLFGGDQQSINGRIPVGVGIDFASIGLPDNSDALIDDFIVELSDPKYLRPDAQIVILGHSLGGDTAMKLAQRMSTELPNVEIDVLGLLDPVGFNPNVRGVLQTLAPSTFGIPGFGSLNVGGRTLNIPSNNEGTPGFFVGTNLDTSSVPSNVANFFNGYQTNVPFPLEVKVETFGLTNRMISIADSSATNSIQREFSTREYYDALRGGPENRVAFLAPKRFDVEPFVSEEREFLGVKGNVPVPNGNFLKTNAQLHHDFPDNNDVQNVLSALISSVDPRNQPDRLEGNDTLATATRIPAVPLIQIADLTIHSGQDVDLFRVAPNDSGLLSATINYCGDDGNLILEILDASGAIVATGTFSQTSTGTNTIQSVVTAVDEGGEYYVRVRGLNSQVNVYDLSVANLAVNTPNSVDLKPASDTGRYNDDDITADETLDSTIHADLRSFAAFPNLLLGPNDIANELAFQRAGAAVVQLVSNSVTGQLVDVQVASRAGGVSTYLFDATTLPLGDGHYVASAAIRLFDGAGGYSDTELSPPLDITLDTTAPFAPFLGLAGDSDSGVEGQAGTFVDEYTSGTIPTLIGIAETGSFVDLNGLGRTSTLPDGNAEPINAFQQSN